MKILVISDSHGDTAAVSKAARLEEPDVALHLGDHARDAGVLRELGIPTYAVRGNCDISASEGDMEELNLGGKRVFMTHGNIYGVKSGLSQITDAAIRRGADILLFGHTHIPLCRERDGLLTVNPGSLRYGEKTYAVLNIEHGAAECVLKSLV